MTVSTTTHKASQRFTNIYEHPSDSYEILAFYYSQPTKIPSSLRQGDAVAHISTNSGCYFAWHFFFFPNLLIKRNPIHGYYDLLFCPSACQALSPWTFIKGTAENEGSPGKGYDFDNLVPLNECREVLQFRRKLVSPELSVKNSTEVNGITASRAAML